MRVEKKFSLSFLGLEIISHLRSLLDEFAKAHSFGWDDGLGKFSLWLRKKLSCRNARYEYIRYLFFVYCFAERLSLRCGMHARTYMVSPFVTLSLSKGLGVLSTASQNAHL